MTYDYDVALKPCPFCGSAGQIDKLHVKNKLYRVECSNGYCIASYMLGNDFQTPQEAADAWNTRHDVEKSENA